MYLLLMYELSTVYCVLSHLEIFAHGGENYGVTMEELRAEQELDMYNNQIE